MAKFKNQGKALGPPASGPSHIHHHTPGQAGSIVALAVLVILGLILLWPAGIFLLDKAGVRRPEEVWASILLWVPAAIGVYFLGRMLVIDIMDRRYEHKEIMADKHIELMRYQQMMTRSLVTDSRQLGEEKRFAALVLAVMIESYQYVARNGDTFRGSERPWSRRQAGGQVLYSLGESQPVGEGLGARVRSFLEEQRVIVDDQVNLADFPDLASVQRLLYNAPVVVGTPKQLGQGGGSEWSIIE